MKTISTKEIERQAIYAERKTRDIAVGLNEACERCGAKGDMQRHHTNGRNEILLYIYVCRGCHEFIHTHPDIARREGYLN